MLARGLGLVATIVVARILGKEGFGELGIIQSTVGMFGTFAGFGLGLTGTKFVAQLRDTDPVRAARILSLTSLAAWGTATATAAIMVAFAPWLAEHTLAAPKLATEIQLGALLLVLSTVNGAQTGALSGFEAFRQIAKIALWTGLGQFPCLIGGCLVWDVRGALIGLAGAQGLACLLSRHALADQCRRHGMSLSVGGLRDELPILWSFSLPAVAALWITSAARWLANTLIVRQPNGFGEIALCTVGAQFLTVLTFLPSLLTTAALPILSDLQAKSGVASTRNFVWKSLWLNLALAAALCSPLILGADIILRLYGPDYEGHGMAFASFLLAGAAAAGSRFVSYVLASREAMGVNLLTNLLWSAALLVIVALLRHKGALAMGLGLLGAYCMHLLVPCIYLWLVTPRGVTNASGAHEERSVVGNLDQI